MEQITCIDIILRVQRLASEVKQQALSIGVGENGTSTFSMQIFDMEHTKQLFVKN